MTKTTAQPEAAATAHHRVCGRSGRRSGRATASSPPPDALLPGRETPYRVVVEDLTEVICRFTVDGTLTFVNDAYCRCFGKTRTELVGAPWRPIVVSEDMPGIDEQLRTLSPANPVVTIEHRVRSANGDVRWMQFVNRAFFDAAGGLVDVQAVGRDVTERRQAEQELRASEERQRTILRVAMDGFWRGDSHGRLLEVNDAYCRMSGYSEAELLSMCVWDLDILDTQVRIAARRRFIAKHGPRRFETRHRRKDGTAFDVEITMQHIAAAGGYFVGFLRDITDRVQARERDQRCLQDVIGAREEERKLVSSALHHDVGSLAIGVSARLDAIEAGLRAGEPGKAITGLRQTRRLFEQSVDRLKTLAVQLRPPDLDVLGICAALRQHFAQTTVHGSPRIRFTETLGRKRVPPAVATTLFRVAQEALTNAITHGHATRVDVALTLSARAIALTVRDNGQGFDLTVHRARGSQLGLRVMAEMAAAAGGTFEVSGGPGRGTRVRVALPRPTTRKRT